ncbi:Flavocytochrome C OS=Bosea thiooxidans OX=53254 GN=ARD30_15255 PE=4 SV=1 [Bosea thiooxidans]
MQATRRSFMRIGFTASGVLALGCRPCSAKPRVVVIGGGAGGATAARYLAKDSNGAIAVTLVEENEVYQTCFHSNLFLGGFKQLCRHHASL